MYCTNCGSKLDETQKFCDSCGSPVEQSEESDINEGPRFQDQLKGTFLNATERVNRMVGEEGNIDVNLKDVFSSVLEKHTDEEAEELFIVGTQSTTPLESNISSSWPKPWLFSRVFLVLAITYGFLYIGTTMFENLNTLPGMIIIGSFAVPFSLLIFFWEMNAPRNISFYEILKMLFVGGTGSLIATLLIFAIFPIYELDFTGAIFVGIFEEIGKLVIIAYFIKKINPKYILNGLLIGATIGTGFAAFESAGYAFTFGQNFGREAMISLIFLRGWMSIGTHVVWSAIAGAALVYVKGSNKLTQEHFTDGKFIRLFSVSVILHAVWDMPLEALQNFYFLYIVLILIAWIFILTLINAGLKQITRLAQN